MACRDCKWWAFFIEREYTDGMPKTKWGRCENEEGTYLVSSERDHCPQFKERTDGE